jgi:hypothetical protein
MNPQGIFPGNGDADESGPLARTPFAMLDIESGLTSQLVIPDYKLLRRIGRGSLWRRVHGAQSYLIFDSWWDGLRDDPRFKKLSMAWTGGRTGQDSWSTVDH